MKNQTMHDVPPLYPQNGVRLMGSVGIVLLPEYVTCAQSTNSGLGWSSYHALHNLAAAERVATKSVTKTEHDETDSRSPPPTGRETRKLKVVGRQDLTTLHSFCSERQKLDKKGCPTLFSVVNTDPKGFQQETEGIPGEENSTSAAMFFL